MGFFQEVIAGLLVLVLSVGLLAGAGILIGSALVAYSLSRNSRFSF